MLTICSKTLTGTMEEKVATSLLMTVKELILEVVSISNQRKSITMLVPQHSTTGPLQRMETIMQMCNSRCNKQPSRRRRARSGT
jgi:hypothetical protein